jgi:hypothetical protein
MVELAFVRDISKIGLPSRRQPKMDCERKANFGLRLTSLDGGGL